MIWPENFREQSVEVIIALIAYAALSIFLYELFKKPDKEK